MSAIPFPSDTPSRPRLVTRLELITPGIAAEYLATNTANRRLRGWWVDELARLIQAGKWETTHQGIGFDVGGRLIDGQHRLHAIIKAGVGVYCQVTRGLARQAVFDIDVGIGRNAVDVSSALGTGQNFTTQEIATARAMKAGMDHVGKFSGRGNVGLEEMVAYTAKHIERIRRVHGWLQHKDVSLATVRAAVAKASFHEDEGRLERFCGVLSTSITTGDEEAAAVRLRTVLINERRYFNSSAGRVALMAKTQAAIRAFMRRQPIAKLQAVDSDHYPIPGEV